MSSSCECARPLMSRTAPGVMLVRPSTIPAAPVSVPALDRTRYRWTAGDVTAVGALALLTTVLVVVSTALNYLTMIVGIALVIIMVTALADEGGVLIPFPTA